MASSLLPRPLFLRHYLILAVSLRFQRYLLEHLNLGLSSLDFFYPLFFRTLIGPSSILAPYHFSRTSMPHGNLADQ